MREQIIEMEEGQQDKRVKERVRNRLSFSLWASRLSSQINTPSHSCSSLLHPFFSFLAFLSFLQLDMMFPPFYLFIIYKCNFSPTSSSMICSFFSVSLASLLSFSLSLLNSLVFHFLFFSLPVIGFNFSVHSVQSINFTLFSIPYFLLLSSLLFHFFHFYFLSLFTLSCLAEKI